MDEWSVLAVDGNIRNWDLSRSVPCYFVMDACALIIIIIVFLLYSICLYVMYVWVCDVFCVWRSYVDPPVDSYGSIQCSNFCPLLIFVIWSPCRFFYRCVAIIWYFLSPWKVTCLLPWALCLFISILFGSGIFFRLFFGSVIHYTLTYYCKWTIFIHHIKWLQVIVFAYLQFVAMLCRIIKASKPC